MTTDPIFIHSLFRTAGGYFLQKFRSLGSEFTCYQEPFSESLVALNDPAQCDRLLEHERCPMARHLRPDQVPFYEFWARRQQLQGLFCKGFAYQQYFVGEPGRLPPEQLAYLSALIEHAAGRPVLQFHRSSGRAQALQREYVGVHIHLWREPRAQWWSYKPLYYFDDANQRIYRSSHLPEALRRIAATVGIDTVPVAHLGPRDNYLMFYGLWLDAWLRLRSHAQLSIGLDGISVSRSQNAECSRQLVELTGCAIDLSDARAAGMVFTPDEDAFYAEVEQAVNAVFVQTGRGTARSVEAATDAARDARRAHERCKHDRRAERNLRHAALVMMSRLAGQRHARQRWSTRALAAQLWNYWRSFKKAPPPFVGAADGSSPFASVADLSLGAGQSRLR